MLLLLLGVAAGWAYRQLHREPDYWREWQRQLALAGPEQRQRLEQVAEDLQIRLAGLFNLLQPDGRPVGDGQGLGRRTLSLSTLEANAWLQTCLEPWLANQGPLLRQHGISVPAEVAQPMVVFQGGQVVLAFEYRGGHTAQVVSLLFAPAVPQPGELSLRLAGLRLGCLQPPLWAVQRLGSGLGQAAGPVMEQMRSAVEGLRFDAAWTLDPRRTARLVGVQVRPDGLDVAFEAVRR